MINLVLFGLLTIYKDSPLLRREMSLSALSMMTLAASPRSMTAPTASSSSSLSASSFLSSCSVSILAYRFKLGSWSVRTIDLRSWLRFQMNASSRGIS